MGAAAKERQLEVLVAATTPVPAVDWSRWFKRWLDAVPAALSPLDAYEVGLTLTDDAAIQALNGAYRHQDRPTDVLSFAALEHDTPLPVELLRAEPLYLGDIIISVETACRQATEAEHRLEQELLWLAVHGFLHLLGWDHPDDESLVKMLNYQRELLGLAAESPEK